MGNPGNKIKHSELIAKIDDAGYPNPEDKLRRLIRYGDITHKDIIKDYQVAEPGEARKLFKRSIGFCLRKYYY